MNAAEEQLRAGDLAGCLSDLQQQVRRSPADPRQRIFLAQLLMVIGDWDRAVAQLEVLGSLDASALPMVQRSGVTPKRPWAPPMPRRNPVITSSKIRIVPVRVQASRTPSR